MNWICTHCACVFPDGGLVLVTALYFGHSEFFGCLRKRWAFSQHDYLTHQKKAQIPYTEMLGGGGGVGGGEWHLQSPQGAVNPQNFHILYYREPPALVLP